MQIKSLFKYFGKKFKCPVCGYKGAFQTVRPPTGIRKYALCPKCRSGERHRLQYLVLEQYLSKLPTKSMAMLHFAPEPFFTQYFSSHFDTYVTADLY
jgi:hypothetical protein